MLKLIEKAILTIHTRSDKVRTAKWLLNAYHPLVLLRGHSREEFANNLPEASPVKAH